MVKTKIWFYSDTEARRGRHPTGLDTLVVYTVNDEL